jgi:hypothetical protein
MVLLDVDVIHYRCLCPLVLKVPVTQRQENLMCERLDDVNGVRRPNDIDVCQAVDLPDEVSV